MHSLFPVSVHIFLMRDSNVLMLRRQNTGYEDGRLSVVAGHVEFGESVREAAAREMREEVGLAVPPDSFRLVGAMHRLSDAERIDFFVECAAPAGEPRNLEPHLCSDLAWTPRAAPPPDTIPYVADALVRPSAPWVAEFGWSGSRNTQPASKAQARVRDFLEEFGLQIGPAERLVDLTAEVGEIAKAYLKSTDYGTRPFKANAEWTEELGDALFALSALADATGVDLDRALVEAIQKYEARALATGSPGSGH